MKVITIFLAIAVVSTGFAILGFTHGEGMPEAIAFPSVTKTVEKKTQAAYLGGCAAATGDGRFIVIGSDNPGVKTGDTWKARGLGRVTWGDKLQFRALGTPQTASEGRLKCLIEIPDFPLTGPARVSGHLLMDGTYADTTDAGHFHNVSGKIASENFALFLYPLNESRAAGMYAFCRQMVLISLLAWFLTLAAWGEHVHNKRKRQAALRANPANLL